MLSFISCLNKLVKVILTSMVAKFLVHYLDFNFIVSHLFKDNNKHYVNNKNKIYISNINKFILENIEHNVK